jgi:hypothetical protein
MIGTNMAWMLQGDDDDDGSTVQYDDIRFVNEFANQVPFDRSKCIHIMHLVVSMVGFSIQNGCHRCATYVWRGQLSMNTNGWFIKISFGNKFKPFQRPKMM